ncbi:pentapeptide repeat-containing protein [Myxococcus landrumensis]|uniref:Pentapeptide repeat-containing protein n=1 Tax=Myxococcus landrumensis TaxID=2813577 RepID=A0ABX7NE38_9BACT|nr:pentapeptide repeat-containing protein [Myxococcus landrumus]QSQ17070.1 pentapeptide repeat-containing protein [Myxococcus landrumus]
MSSDCFYVRVGKLAGKTVTLHCLTGFAGGLKDYATTRSFALLLLIDAQERAGDTPELTQGAPKEVAKLRKALAKKVAKARSPLLDEVLGPHYDEHWHAENTPRYVTRVKLLQRHNAIQERKLEKVREELSPLEDKGTGAFLEAAWGRMHGFDLQVEVTDAKYLAHLAEGHLFPTTAFDVWNESKPLPPKEKEEPAAKLKPTAAPKGHYAGEVLDSSFWPSTFVSQTSVSGSNFQRANLTNIVHTRHIQAEKCDFTKALVTQKTSWDLATHIHGWKLKGSVFRGASLKDALFSDCDLRHCDFTDADLSDARFVSSNLKGAIFKGANLKNALIPPELARQVDLQEAKNYSPAPGGKPGAKCRALDRLLFQAQAIEFTVDYATPAAYGNSIRISLGRFPYIRSQPDVYRLSLLTRAARPKATFGACYSADVEEGKFGARLRRLSDDFQTPRSRKLDLSTLTVTSKGAPLDAREVKDVIQAALEEIFNES